jgi:hypothetical protein
LTPKFEWGSSEKCLIPKFGFSSQSGGVVVVGLGGVGDGGALDADEEEDFDDAESDACSLIDASCELVIDVLEDCVARARFVLGTVRTKW